MLYILDKIEAIIRQIPGAPQTILQNNLQPKPDQMIGLFDYAGTPPAQTFGDADGFGEAVESYRVQVRSRALSITGAETAIAKIAGALEGYGGGDIVIKRVSSILPIGQDDANPARWEYTANFEITPVA